MNTSISAASAAIAAPVCILLAISPASAQSFGLYANGTSAGYDEVLEAPLGVAVRATVPLLPRVHLRLSAARAWEGHTRTRSTCTGLVDPDAPCPVDTFDGDSRLDVLSAGLQVRLGSLGPWTSSVFGGLDLTTVSSDFVGRETGVNIGPIDPEPRRRGWHAGLGVEYATAWPVDLSTELIFARPDIGTCGADAWFAFCRDATWVSLRVGASLNAH